MEEKRNIVERVGSFEKAQGRRTLRALKRQARIEKITSIPVASLAGLGSSASPSPSPAPGAAAWWMDPKILLVGAAALVILLRKK